MIVRTLALLGLLTFGAHAQECISPAAAQAKIAEIGGQLAPLDPAAVAAVQKDYTEQTGDETRMSEIDMALKPDGSVFLVLYQDGCVFGTATIPAMRFQEIVGRGA